MTCKQCEVLRKALSPMEDSEFTAQFLAAARVGYDQQVRSLRDVWASAFETPPNVFDLTKLGRTLDALGWRRTKRNGFLFFIPPNPTHNH
jgi:hypothetical protein